MNKTDNNDKRSQDKLFFEGLAENDNTKLLKVPMSDIHNHSTKGCTIEKSKQVSKDSEQ